MAVSLFFWYRLVISHTERLIQKIYVGVSWQELGAVSCFRDGSAGGRPELEKTSATGSGAPVSKLVTCHRFMIMRGIEWDHYKNVFQTKSSVSCRRERCFLLRASFDNHSDRSSGWGGVAFHCKNKLFESALQ